MKEVQTERKKRKRKGAKGKKNALEIKRQ